MRKHFAIALIILSILYITGCADKYAYSEDEIRTIDKNASEAVLELSVEADDWHFNIFNYYAQSDSGLRIVHRVYDGHEELHRNGRNYIYRSNTIAAVNEDFFPEAQTAARSALEKMKKCFEERLFESIDSTLYTDIDHAVVYTLNEEGESLFQDAAKEYVLIIILVHVSDDLSFMHCTLGLKRGDESGKWDTFSFGDNDAHLSYSAPWETVG